MKYFIDTEFIEGFSKCTFAKNRHFIDLISIGIVADNGRTYYAISNEFNPDDANEWVKENVLYAIMLENGYHKSLSNLHGCLEYRKSAVRSIQKNIGKSNKQIATEVTLFCNPANEPIFSEVEFYGYYADYDWVLFCSLFGRMLDLPKGFPMYCRDLKQMLDEHYIYQEYKYGTQKRLDSWLKTVKAHPLYPKQENEHNALSDAKWNKELYEFITKQKFLQKDTDSPVKIANQ